jgi:hypothetical protein
MEGQNGMNTKDRVSEMARFNHLFGRVRRLDPTFSPHQYAYSIWGTREIFNLSHVELQQLNGAMEYIISRARLHFMDGQTA